MILGSAFKLSPLMLLTGSRLARSERFGRGIGRRGCGLWDSVCAFRRRAFFQHMIIERAKRKKHSADLDRRALIKNADGRENNAVDRLRRI